ncbi:fluoride efflux transporter CrcB [Streptomyces sp. NPDC047737]|uniref:fluoride efflux transporter CrcB n=1 Tax=unclassified Streptomyces TaxID=2593676 RepID=UPI0033DB6491
MSDRSRPAERPDAGPGDGPSVSGQRAGQRGGGRWRVLAVIAAGGAAGATARYAASLAWPAAEGEFPWAVFAVNVVGCALIGVLMVLTVERGVVTRPLVRPFLGVGVLGGFTTFSTYAADVSHLLVRQEVATAVAYMAGTAVAALCAVWAAAAMTRAVANRAGRAG